MDQYIFFYGHNPTPSGNHIYSQFYPCKFTDPKTGIVYCCAEQWMMSQKALMFNDKVINEQILAETNAATIKSYGRSVHGYNDAIWCENRFNIVVQGNYYKFSQNPELLQTLLSTDPKILVEASPYDRVWGIGLNANQAAQIPPHQWPGDNLLGRALMQVRTMIQNEIMSKDTPTI